MYKNVLYVKVSNFFIMASAEHFKEKWRFYTISCVVANKIGWRPNCKDTECSRDCDLLSVLYYESHISVNETAHLIKVACYKNGSKWQNFFV